ncbi:autotransporter domain-containing protein [Sphingomonas echinoides]|uniref:autotransporter domain-containing protein n=1 Tax=Sphingomonas echinoides TaxID=59803 RepID=UPI0024132643|nr:autotransporter domain-containing protein [Sphingomonas echinoides]
MAIAAGILAAAFFPAQAHAQSSGCSAINGGLLDFQSVFANGEPTSGTTSNYQIHVALSMMRTTTAYTDNVTGSSFVPDGMTTYAFVTGDRVVFNTTVSSVTSTTRIRIRSAPLGSSGGGYAATGSGARVDTSTPGTFTGSYTVPAGLQAVGMSVDTVSGNSVSSAVVTCIPFVDPGLSLGVTMTHGGTPAQNGTVDYTITPSASGASTGTNLTLAFTLPAGLSFASGSGSGWSCTSTRCTYGNAIGSGASGNPLTLRANVASTASTSLTPSVTLSGGNAGNAANASDPTTIAQTAASVSVDAGNNQTAAAETAFATPLSVTVRDAANAVIPNAAVTFTAPASGASGSFTNTSNTITVTASGAGVASSGTFTANATAGAYSVLATAGSVSATFSLSNTAVVGLPTVTAITPTSGTTAGGTSVVVTGTNLTGASAVQFGGAGATSFIVDSATQITATTAAASAGVVDVTVTTPGGTSATSGATQFTYVVPPATPTIPSAPPALSNSASATFQFTIANGSAECAIDNGSFTACVSPVTFSGLSDGAHVFQVRATNGGLTGSPASYNWTIDASAPAAPVVTTPANGSNRAVSERGVSGTAEPASTVTVYLDGTPDGTTTTAGSGQWSFTLTALTAGPHTVKAHSTDAAGNVSTDSAVSNFTAVTALTATQAVPSVSATINTALTPVQPVTASGGLAPISYALSGGTLPPGLSFDTVTGQLSGTPTATLSPTTFTVTATDALPQSDARTFSLSVGNASQTIAFTSTAPVAAVIGGASYTPAATATSGLTVTFTIDGASSGVCAIAGGAVSFSGAGTCRVNADQSGNASFSAAPQVQQSFVVAAASQTIAFTSTVPAAAVVGGASYTPTATATSGLTVAFTIDGSSSGVCAIAGGAVSFSGAGTCRVNADQSGNAGFSAAPQVQQSFVVGAASQTIAFTSTAPVAAVVGGAGYTPTATATSGLTVAFTIDSSSTAICTYSAGVVGFTGTGTCRINADQPGNANYGAAPQAQQSFAVGMASQTISFTTSAPGTARVGGADYTPAATATSGLPVVLTIDAGSSAICTLSGSSIAFTAAGTCLIDANQAGNAGYAAAPQVQQSVTVAKGDQTITFSGLGNASLSASPLSLSATAGSGLVVQFASSTSAVCTVAGTTLALVSQGTCTVTADQPGDVNWNAAPTVTRSFTVLPVTLAVSSGSVATAVVGTVYTQTNTATGGVAPYHFTLAGGALPPGVSLDAATGTVSGSPTQAGAFSYTLSVSDSAAPPSTVTGSAFGGSIAKGSQTLAFTSSPPVPAIVGGSYAVVAVSSATLSPSYAIESASSGVCSLAGSTVSFVAAGTCVILADQAGTNDYDAASQVNQSITVLAAPTTADRTVAVPYDAAGTAIDLSSSIGGGAHVSIAIVTPPTHGTATVAGDTVTYVSASGYFGADSFTFNATGPGGTSAPATVQITVATPAIPGAAAGSADVAYDSPGQAIPLQPSGVFASLAIATAPTKGTVTIAGTTATYIPTPASFGADSFTYTATGPGGTSPPATIAITIALPATPGAANTTAQVAYGATGQAIALLPSGVYTSVTLATPPTKGTVTIAGTTATYVPNAGSFGADSFTYTATGPGGTSAPGTVSVTIATPAAPGAANVSADVAFGSSGQPIALAPSGVYTTLDLGTLPTKGTVTITGTTALYVPNAGSFGTDSFTYTATGPGGTSAPGTVSVTIATPAAPGAANVSADVAFGSSGQPITLTPSGVHTTLGLATLPTKGTVTITGTTALYVPNAGSFGADSFTYTATGPGGTSAPGTVSVSIAAPPPPVAAPIDVAAAGTTVEGGASVGIDLAKLISGTFATIEIVTQPAHGIVTLRPPGAARASGARSGGDAGLLAVADWTAVYAPQAGYAGKDSFQFVAVGPGGRSLPAVVEITVSGQPPTALAKTAMTGDAQTVSVELTEGAIGAPFTTATIDGITPADAATARIVQGGTAAQPSYRLDLTTQAHFGGKVIVRYRLGNVFGLSAPAEVTVTVTARPDPSADPVVRAIADAQAETARRFARTQVSNFMARAQQLHHGGGATNPLGIALNLRDAVLTPGAPNTVADDSAMSPTGRNRFVSRSVAEATLPGRSIGNAPADERSFDALRGSDTAGHEQEDRSTAGPRPIGDVALWTGGSIEIGTLDRRSGRAKITLASGGLSTGADIRIADWATLGLGGGYGSDVSLIDGEAARVRGETKVFAAYGSFAPIDGAFVDAMVGHGSLDYTTRRLVASTGELARGRRDGHMTFGAVSAGVDRETDDLRWSGYGRLEWLNGKLDAYSETGATRYALRFDTRSVRSLTGVVGGRLEVAQDLGFARVSPRIAAEWLHEFQTAGVQSLDYADFTGASTYRIRGTGWQREQYQVSIGSRWSLMVRWMIDMELGMRGAAGEHAAQARLRISKRF